MSDARRLSNIKWIATGVDGHTHHTCAEWMYTSDAPPVEADEYERMKARAEAAEAQLAAVPRQSIDALFRQQFGTYPIWFNETWTPIADWLGYKAKPAYKRHHHSACGGPEDNRHRSEDKESKQ